MLKIRNQDLGPVAPKTGCIKPVGLDKQRWEAMCYKCGTVSKADSRKEVIELHRSHWDIDHADDPK